MLKKFLKKFAIVVGFAGLLFTASYALQNARIGTGYVAHTLCGQVFVSGRSAAKAYADFVEPIPLLSLLRWAIASDIDSKRQEIRVTLFGGFESRAAARENAGCMMLYSNEEPIEARALAAPPPAPADPERPTSAAAMLPEIAGPNVIEPSDDRLREAIDRLFAEQEGKPKLRTKAVVIVHHGRVIAERYAPEYGVNTPLVGFSATKSVTNALVGILVRHGRLIVGTPAPVGAWSQAGDPRRTITIEHLMRMTSGLDWDEALDSRGPDMGGRMNWAEPDMTAFAESRALVSEPGTAWNYSTGNTVILSRIIRDSVGGSAADVLRFAKWELFEPLGMRNVTMTLDATGTPLGGSFLFASARDWARFGLLYLNDGVIAGRRILPQGWAEFSSAPTPTAPVGYGAGFWTNRGSSRGAERRAAWGMPRDSFFASGYFGQMIVVVPSANLIVARFGVSESGLYTFEKVSNLVADAVAAISP
jgi:CubicO group peptidase (beta-lactamase class C family)